MLVWNVFEKDCNYDSFTLTVGVFEKRKSSKFKISIREGPQKKFFWGKLSQIWVGGVSDSQTDPKRNLKSPFLTNFTLCVSNCHKKHLVGFKYLGKFRKKRFWGPPLKGNVLTCVITSSSLFPASSLLRIHGKWTILLVKLSELPLLEVIDY